MASYKKETLEEIAKREADAERLREESRALYVANQLELAKHVPSRFFQLALELRDAVVRFNTAADPNKRISWRESAALAAKDTNLNADFNLSMSRAGAEISLSLNALGRSGKPDAYLIEAHGVFPNDGFMLRVDGSINRGKPTYRLSLNFKRLPYEIEELAERMVKALVKCKVTELADLYPQPG
jgi:hypothetical protein